MRAGATGLLCIRDTDNRDHFSWCMSIPWSMRGAVCSSRWEDLILIRCCAQTLLEKGLLGKSMQVGTQGFTASMEKSKWEQHATPSHLGIVVRGVENKRARSLIAQRTQCGQWWDGAISTCLCSVVQC